MKSTPEDEPKKTVLDRLIGSLKWGTIGTVAGAAAGVGLGAIARQGHFGRQFKRYASRKFPLFPTPAVTHAIAGAGVGSKVGALAGLVAGRKKKDVNELSALLDNLIEFAGEFSLNTAKRVLRGLAEGAEKKVPMLRPKGRPLETAAYAPPWDQIPSEQSKLLWGVKKVEPNTIVIPRERGMKKAAKAQQKDIRTTLNLKPGTALVENPLAAGFHETGHAYDPSLKGRIDMIKSVQEKFTKKPPKAKTAMLLANKVVSGMIEHEKVANTNVLNLIKEHGTPQEAQSWKRIANRQMHKGYRAPVFTGMTMGDTLSKKKKYYRDNPWVQKSTTNLSSMLDGLIQFEWGDRILTELKNAKPPLHKKVIAQALLTRTIEANRLRAAKKMVMNTGSHKEAQSLFQMLPDKASNISTRQLVLQTEALRRHNLLK